MRVRTPLVIFFLLALLALVQAGAERRSSPTTPRIPSLEQEGRGSWMLSAHGADITIELVDSAAERIRGLSGREKLGANQGMLLVFPRSDYHGIWMKEMRFPLDVIWLEDTTPQSFPVAPTTPSRLTVGTPLLGQEGMGRAERTLQVVDIKENVLPETFPRVFYPKEKAKYVLEVNAGVAGKARVKTGETFVVAR